jgi:hypothetical protein
VRGRGLDSGPARVMFVVRNLWAGGVERGLWIMLGGTCRWGFGSTGVGVVLLCLLVLVPGALAAGDVTSGGEACPNEASPGFRVYLPDCRGYELVSPPFKDGTELLGIVVSEDGSRVLADSLGAFAGAGSDTETHGAEYELARSPAGWTVSAISPAAVSLPAQVLHAASPDLAETLWVGRSPSESLAAENFYLREADGALVKVGSLIPPGAAVGPPAGESQAFLYSQAITYLDASADLSHVLFELQHVAEAELAWPGDTTFGRSSLYEYVGVDAARPELVGVNNEGQLISRCETLLGSQGDTYNALSADGGTVYFTAAGENAGGCAGKSGVPLVSELYARLGGVETIAISEPTPQQCVECNVPATVGEGRRPAAFAGASLDGSKVFFLTEQELLAGAGTTSLYEYDFDNPAKEHVLRVSTGSPTPEVQGVARVSEDGSHVYFVARGRLTKGARQGDAGKCVAELTVGEKAEEGQAEEQEEKAEAVTVGGKCRPKEGGDNLYVFERDAAYPAGRVSFIATLCSGKETSGSLAGVEQCPSRGEDSSDWGVAGTLPVADQRPVQATGDGRFVVFKSVGDLADGDTLGEPQIFEYDAASEELVWVSAGSSEDEPQATEAANKNGANILEQRYAFEQDSPAEPGTRLMVSGDGSLVTFTSRGALTAGAMGAAEAGKESVYEYRSTVGAGGSIGDGDDYLISDGVNTQELSLVGLDAAGGDVFFTTADELVPQDTDTQLDLYDARVDGGFPAPDPPAGCVGEACGGSLFVQPAFAAPGSATVAGAGSPVPVLAAAAAVAAPRLGVAARVRAERLARALRACRSGARSRRRACEARARKRYGMVAKAKRSVAGKSGGR